MGHHGLPAAGLPPPPGSLWTEGPVRLRHRFFYSLAGILYDSSPFVKGEVLVLGKIHFEKTAPYRHKIDFPENDPLPLTKRERLGIMITEGRCYMTVSSSPLNQLTLTARVASGRSTRLCGK